VIAVVVAIALVATIPGMRDTWADGEGRIAFMETTYCFYDGADTSHCQPGDELVVTGDEGPPRPAPVVPATPRAPALPSPPADALAPAEPAQPGAGID
jgi:hypothetical protein